MAPSCRRGCPSCGAESPPGAKFCIECGTALGPGPGAPPPGSGAAAPPTAEAAAPVPERPPAGGLFGGQVPEGAPAWGPLAAGALPEERRKATVLFADLSGYTAVAERMDPEAVKSFIDRALRSGSARRSSATAAPSTSTSATT